MTDHSIDDIWQSMKAQDNTVSEEYKRRSQALRPPHISSIPHDINHKKTYNKKNKKKKHDIKEKKDRKGYQDPIETVGDPVVAIRDPIVTYKDDTIVNEKQTISAQDMLQKISRDINTCESGSGVERRKALSRIHTALTEETTMSMNDYSELFSEISRPLFKRFADTVEKCRDLSFRITTFLFQNGADFVPVLGYYIPALLQRAPATLAYDQEMQIFVWDAETHDAYKRGRAVDRQDAANPSAPVSVTVVEPSEEVRLLTCQSLTTLIKRLDELQALSVLNPYFSDVVLFLQSQVRDPYPELKIEAIRGIEHLAITREYESVALVRAVMPALRHRHAKVRAPAVDAVRACVHVPNRAKRKGAGTEAIAELVGFKESNVLQVSAFYKTEVSVNYLAEVTSDSSVQVRERVVLMLSSFLTELEDRYDHQTRLLPYLLDMLSDETSGIRNTALECLMKCGKQYEEDHPDEIIERRQYGIDGDDRCNLDKPLPPPFTERPRIGIRIYVRGNTKRFLFALVGELTNWQCKTRLKSARLLKTVLILCEEYLTMEAHKLLPAYVKALGFAREDKDKELETLLLEICELCGRYTAPETYVHYILPRLRGDAEIVQFGVDSATRCCVMDALKNMLEGSKASLVPPYLTEIIDTIVDPCVIDIESLTVHETAVNLLNSLLYRVQGRGLAATEAHYQSTGRLKSMKETITKAFRFLFLSLNKTETCKLASTGLTYLSALDFDSRATGVRGLFTRQIPIILGGDLLSTNTDDYEFHDPISPEFSLLDLSVSCPWCVVQQSVSSLLPVIEYICHTALHQGSNCSSSLPQDSGIQINVTGDGKLAGLAASPTDILCRYSDLLLATLSPVFGVSGVGVPSDPYIHLYTDSGATQTTCVDMTDLPMNIIHRVVDVFVAPAVWSAESALQVKRLKILSMLLLHSAPHEYQQLKKTQNFIEFFLHSHMEVLLRNVFPASSSPSTVASVRQLSIDLLCRALEMLAGNTRAVPYKKLDESSSVDRVLVDKGHAEGALRLLMSVVLDDSCDTIRIACLHALLYLVPFIPRNDDSVALDSTTIGRSICDFRGIVDRLLHRVVESNPTPDFLDMLDTVLRSIATLSPSDFEEIVRQNMNLLSGENQAPSAASEIFSGLIDHCDMMLQFQSMQMG